jgi:hypothetical protein
MNEQNHEAGSIEMKNHVHGEEEGRSGELEEFDDDN